MFLEICGLLVVKTCQLTDFWMFAVFSVLV